MAPLVSILIPAYHPQFFAQALASARAQTWEPCEIVVCDDSPGEEIRAAVEAQADARVRYERHAPALGFAGNFTRCLALARGEWVKFLNDDDLLAPHCVARLLEASLANPGTVIASSRRTVIDAEGRRLEDEDATQPLAPGSRAIAGPFLGRLLLLAGVNRFGEPSTVLFRRDAVAVEGGNLFRWGANEYLCLADLSLWLRLLAVGHAWWDEEPLSAYRRHAGQLQRSPAAAARCVIERWLLAEDGLRAGFITDPAEREALLRNAGTNFRFWMQRPDAPPEFREALDRFAPRVPAQYQS